MTKSFRVSKNTRVRHADRGFAMKYGDVEKGIAQCALIWVVKGETFRDLTAEEAYDARCARERESEPLAHAEVRGVLFRRGDAGSREIQREILLANVASHMVASLSDNGKVSGIALRRARIKEARVMLFEGAVV